MKVVRLVCAVGGLLAAAFTFTSCFYNKSPGLPIADREFKGISRIVAGMSEGEVKRLLGTPGEIRPLDPEHLLDGAGASFSPFTTNCEVQRWAYGLRQPGTFAREGIVSFDGERHVISVHSPIDSVSVSADPTPPRTEVAGSPDGLSCRINEINFLEARGESVRAWFAKVTVSNRSDRDFSTDCFVDSIHRQCLVEVYDKDSTLIFRDDHSSRNNGFGSRDSKFTVPAGASRTEELNFSPDYFFGPLPPGRYFLCVWIRRNEGSSIKSPMVEFTVPAFPKDSEYWERFRAKRSTARGNGDDR